ncbi:ATP-binding protein [Streptomyces sp. 8N706]|uniref:ATP-binding protein n=1 Tax=Streptomyces sp. 8N706 TaxID=3457416 RepID=UPI003FCFE21E
MFHTPVPNFSLTFPPDPAWVRMCRETVRTSTLTVKQPSLTELAVLLTSEGVTNAINACATYGCPHPISLYGEWLATGPLRIHVRDAAPGVPAVQSVATCSEHGRGMCLIAEFADRYGICLDGPGPGKSLWFQLEEGVQ